jgi:phosphoribosyl 1,2-cyclic phosphate phosphodiesterase
MEKLRILGTAASEGLPALFCQCELCTEAKKRGGKDLRTRTSMMIGEWFKVDFPPDSNYHMLKYGLNYGKLRYLLISHCHSDHFAVQELENYRKLCAHLKDGGPLRIYLSRTSRDCLFETLDFYRTMEDMNPTELNVIEPYRRYEADELFFTPVAAYHDPGQECYNFYIEMKNGKNIFYGMDAKGYPEETLRFLKKCRIDLCICDATHFAAPCGVHMLYEDVVAFHGFLRSNGVLSRDAKFVVNHFSHNGNNGQPGGPLQMLHENLEKAYGRLGFLVAYDGMEFEV